MKSVVCVALMLAAAVAAVPADAQKKPRLATQKGVLTLYDQANFNGDRMELTKARVAMTMEWNIRSIGIAPGESWDLCDKPKFKGNCVTLNASAADSASAGLAGMIASARPTPKAKK